MKDKSLGNWDVKQRSCLKNIVIGSHSNFAIKIKFIYMCAFIKNFRFKVM